MKFSLLESFDSATLTETQKHYLQGLAAKIEKAPEDADGEWFHLAIYGFKEELSMQPKELFSTLYQAVIGQDSGPRAGWFLSILPRDWLIKRLSLNS
jgi:lysyl-tRNA synthetase class 1